MSLFNGWSFVCNTFAEHVAGFNFRDYLELGLLLPWINARYYLDVIEYWDAKRNLAILEELMKLFRNKKVVLNRK